MTDLSPVESTNLEEHGDRRLMPIEWSAPRELLAAPPPPDTPGGHLASVLGTVRPDGRQPRSSKTRVHRLRSAAG